MDLCWVGSFDSELAEYNKSVRLYGPVQFVDRTINPIVQNLADKVEPVLVADSLELCFIYFQQSFDDAQAFFGVLNL